MTKTLRRRRGAALLGVAIALLLLSAAMTLALSRGAPDVLPARPEQQRPTLLLLTTLPLLFSEGFSLEGGSPALDALESRYVVRPISVADGQSLGGGKLLLMAHPLAQPAEVLVELDKWVRKGGRVLLLADPMLEWPSERPLGDPLRPPPMFADTGLLGHWGLRLNAPESRGPARASAGDFEVRTASPGELMTTGESCKVLGGFVAYCAIGAGRAAVVADADFLHSGAGSENLRFLLAELDRLER